jgi:hypothetical protein
MIEFPLNSQMHGNSRPDPVLRMFALVAPNKKATKPGIPLPRPSWPLWMDIDCFSGVDQSKGAFMAPVMRIVPLTKYQRGCQRKISTGAIQLLAVSGCKMPFVKGCYEVSQPNRFAACPFRYRYFLG